MTSELKILGEYIPFVPFLVGLVPSVILLRGYTIYADSREEFNTMREDSSEEIPKKPTYFGSLRKAFPKDKA